MSSSTARTSRRTVPLLVVTVLLAVVGCGRGSADAAPLNLEGVSTSGDNPFSPSVGTDQPDVTPPPGSGGTFPGDTVGLFGGTQSGTSCDKAKLVAFLQSDHAKAAAWAGVLGVRVDDIQAFIASLTPAILRSDTRVTNHGFKDGKAIEIPAILQAGTAVLVDVHGAPVTKCFCGNPLTAPPAFTADRFQGQKWPNFAPNQVTVIAPVTQNVQQFVFVQPGTSHSFQRPAGTTGREDTPATSPAPTAFPKPPSPPQTGSPTAGPTTSELPPGLAVPSPTESASPSAPSVSPAPVPPTSTPTGPPTSTSSRSPSPATTTPGSPSGTVIPSVPPVVPPESSSPAPTETPSITPTVTATGSPTASASPSPTAPLRASWVVGDCYVRGGRAHGLVLVRPDGSSPHTFTVRVRLGLESNPVAVETVRVAATPGQVGQAEVNVPTPTPDGALQCAVLSIVDEKGASPVAGEPLPPPPDSSPMPAQPGPGAPSGPSVPATPPPPVVPGGSPT